MTLTIDTESDPGAWADAIAHSPYLRVEWFGEDGGGQVSPEPKLITVGGSYLDNRDLMTTKGREYVR